MHSFNPRKLVVSSRLVMEGGISPISSRNTVPPAALSSRPALVVAAPVNAPFS